MGGGSIDESRPREALSLWDGGCFAGVKQGWANSQKGNVKSMFLNQSTCL